MFDSFTLLIPGASIRSVRPPALVLDSFWLVSCQTLWNLLFPCAAVPNK